MLSRVIYVNIGNFKLLNSEETPSFMHEGTRTKTQTEKRHQAQNRGRREAINLINKSRAKKKKAAENPTGKTGMQEASH